MATLILATGSGAATSNPFTLVAGDRIALVLRDVSAPMFTSSVAVLEVQDEAGNWAQGGDLTRNAGNVLSVAGTYRVRRQAGATCGVFRA